MKVEKLIEELQKLPPDSEVVFVNEKQNNYPTYHDGFKFVKMNIKRNSYHSLVDADMFKKEEKEKIKEVYKII